jgi:outer membrane protein assembly factor BamB
MTKGRRIGWIGIVLFGVGAAVAVLGAWYVLHARPKVGETIDTIQIDPDTKFIISAEAGDGVRSFIELNHAGETVWQALIPHYAGEKGRPAIAWNNKAVTVRVDRGNHAEVFALSMESAAKLGGFKLAPDHEPTTTQKTGPITVTDHIRSYELIGTDKWHELVAVDLNTGKALWAADLGHWQVTDAGVETPHVWVIQAKQKRYYNMLNGNENRSLN